MKPRYAPAFLGFFLICAANAHANNAFKDWEVACDNIRFCTAIGAPTETPEAGNGAIRITRAGSPDALASVSIMVSQGVAAAGTRLQLTLDAPGAPTLRTQPLARAPDDFQQHAMLSASDAEQFIAAMRSATRVAVQPVPGSASPTASSPSDKNLVLSLSGSVAAMLYMDDRQKRAGTPSALMAKGQKAMPAAASLTSAPQFSALPMLVEKAAPANIPRQLLARREAREYGRRIQPLKARLSPSATLWAVCTDMGAYNVSYAFFIVDKGVTKQVEFEVPAGKPNMKGVLTNPKFSPDGLTLTAFSKARGVGDGGVLAQWIWAGDRFRLLNFREMDNLLGLDTSAWPTLYQATLAPAR